MKKLLLLTFIGLVACSTTEPPKPIPIGKETAAPIGCQKGRDERKVEC